MVERRLTPEEQELWDNYSSTVTPTASSTVSLVLPSIKPRVNPQVWSSVLDLHDLTLAQAHSAVQSHIKEAHRRGQRKIIIITGRSGQIAKEFPTWVSTNPLVTKRTILNGGGAWKLWVRKKVG